MTLGLPELPRPRCDACAGERKEACDAAFAKLNDIASANITGVFDAERNGVSVDPTLPAQILETGARAGSEVKVTLEQIGCQLTSDQIVVAFLSESSAGMVAAIDDAEAAEEERLRTLLGHARSEMSETRSVLTNVLTELEESRINTVLQYCEEQGWDPKNLDLSQSMDVRRHLREEGLSVENSQQLHDLLAKIDRMPFMPDPEIS